MTDVYKTIEEPAQGIISERGSKFISFIFPVKSVEEIKIHLQELRKIYFDARHHVYAYTIGIEDVESRCSDDGEPSNSSGVHVLGQIRSNNLSNVLIVVVRYFGGTKLGIPGLKNAYKSASADCIRNAKPINMTIMKNIILVFDYADISFVEKMVYDYNMEVILRDYKNSCRIDLMVPKSNYLDAVATVKSNHKIRIIQE